MKSGEILLQDCDSTTGTLIKLNDQYEITKNKLGLVT